MALNVELALFAFRALLMLLTFPLLALGLLRLGRVRLLLRRFLGSGRNFHTVDLAGHGIHHNLAQLLARADHYAVLPLALFVLQRSLPLYFAGELLERDCVRLFRRKLRLG